METLWIYALMSAAAVSAISLIGIATLAFKPDLLKRFIIPLVSLAAGAMFGNAFLHLIPEAFEELGSGLTAPLLVIAGIFLFYIVEHLLHCRHECGQPHESHRVGYLSLMADGLENLIDGVAIGAAYLVSPATGLATTLAVMLHEVPTEVGDFGVLVHSGFTPKQAIRWNLFSALASVVGVVLALGLGASIAGFSAFVAPIAAGAFIYIAAGALLPRVLKATDSHSLVQLLFMAAGVGAMLLLALGE
ncbi:MAG TPA: ZIP family metal transporter [Candidatus Obscuribacterales bacterium]